MTTEKSAIEFISQSLILPCGLKLPNRLVKCPMQETLAEPPFYDPPDSFSPLYSLWARSQYGLLITGQVQIDKRFLSIAGDVVAHENSLNGEHLEQWKKWADVAQSHGTPCIVQLAHPGRMSPIGAGERPNDMQTLCPSAVPVKIGDGWLDKMTLQKMLGTPKEMTLTDIDEVVDAFVHGAIVAKEAGFAGCQLHAAHGFLLSQFLSPHTNRRTDDYGGTSEKRLKLLRRIVTEIREKCPPPYCLSVKLNSGDYLDQGGLGQEEALSQVKWLTESGQIDFIEISGGSAESSSNSKMMSSMQHKSISQAPKRSTTLIREAFFTDFAQKVQSLNSPVPIQLSGGFRSRTGMADALATNTCQLIGLGRSAILEPELPVKVLLNRDYDDEGALAMPHVVRGLWFANLVPVKVVGMGLPVQFFYYNMKRLGRGEGSDPHASIPYIVGIGIWETLRAGLVATAQRLVATQGGKT